MANAASQDVTFKGVTFNSGATLHLNGDKSLTAIDGGSRLIANDLNGASGIGTKGTEQATALNHYAGIAYGVDALVTSNTISNPKSLSEAEFRSNRTYLPSVSRSYWLSNLYSKGNLKWGSYANKSNNSDNMSLYATGRDGNYWYDSTQIARGSYAWAEDVQLSNYTSPYGWSWSVSGTGQQGGYIYTTENSYFGNGTKVYNNPQCLETGTDEYGNPNRATYVQNVSSESGSMYFGRVVADSNGKRVVCASILTDLDILQGTVVYYGFLKHNNELQDPSGFASSSGAYWVGFIKTTSDIRLYGKLIDLKFHPLPGFIKRYSNGQTIIGDDISSSNLAVRPAYDADYSNIAFTRPASSGETLSGIGTFGDAPKSVNSNDDNVKAVVKSESVTIANNLTTNRVTSDRPNVTYADDKIRVPYGAKTLTFDPQAFTTSNASHISALASTENLQSYAVCGTAGGTQRMNLENILNTSQVGSTATVSFYAEKTNDANTSDLISKTPVTVQLEVVDDTEQTISYSLDGGTGTTPASDKVKSGRTYTMANGTGLSRDGNPFSSWQLTYLPYGEANSVTRFVGANESIVVPETSDGKITATAVYAGVMAKKTTETSSSVVTVTWDANSPENANAKFTDAATGEYNTARTKKYDKIKVAGTSVIVPTESDLEIDVTKIFDGWWTSKDESGTKLSEADVQISPTANVTYYAHWMDGYRVTYDATGGSGLVDPSIAGKFANDATTLTETVLPDDALQGPKINELVADPVSADSTVDGYKFMGWFTEPNGGGTKASLGTTKVTRQITYYAYLVRGYKVTYDATGGTGASQTGKFIDNTTEAWEIVFPGEVTVGTGKHDPVSVSPKCVFLGWYNSPNGADGLFDETGTSFDDLGASKMVFAYYAISDTFLAPASSSANPIDVTGNKYSIEQVKAAATEIASNDSSSSYYYQYKDWMDNDSYHLYTLLNENDTNSADSWVEFRIVNVGQLDSDGTGLTFQAVHMLPTAYRIGTGAVNWLSSDLRMKMQDGGDIYSDFDTELTNAAYDVTTSNKGKLWIPSYSELTGDSQSVKASGSQFAYWSGKITNGTDTNSNLVIAGTRSGGSVDSIRDSGCWWERSIYSLLGESSNIFCYVNSEGKSMNTSLVSSYLGIVPCFSL